MKKVISLFVLACFFILTAFSNTSENLHLIEKEEAKNTIALINHINYVVEIIRTYNNVIVLEKEYQTLSHDNLNLEKIPDAEVLELVKKILDHLHSMRMDERARNKMQLELERKINSVKFECWKGAAQNMFKAVTSNDEDGKKGKIGWGGRTKSLLTAALTSALEQGVNFYKLKGEHIANWEDETYKLDSEKLNQLNDLNKSLLDTQWELLKKYKLDDKLRVTSNNVKVLTQGLKNSDRSRSYKIIKRMQNHFEVYPTYWYYRALLAAQNEGFSDALYSASEFQKVNRGLFRRDIMAAMVAMVKISAMLEIENQDLGKVDKECVKKDLEIICDQNYDSSNVDLGIFSAMIYYQLFDDSETALSILDPIYYILEDQYNDKYTSYCDLRKAPTEKNAENIPNAGDLARCRMLRLEIDKGVKKEIDIKKIMDICGRETTSSIEKLFYFGMLRINDLWRFAEKDTLQINVKVTDKSIELGVPVKWFLLGELDISLDLIKGEKVIAEIKENKKERKILSSTSMFDTKIDEMPYVYTTYELSPKILSGISSIRLNLAHKSWPVTVRYEKKYQGDNNVALFVPIKIEKFMGKEFNSSIRLLKSITEKAMSSLIVGGDKISNSQNVALRDLVLEKFSKLQDFKEIYVGDDIPKDDSDFKTSIKRFGIDNVNNILVWCRHDGGLNPNSYLVITPERLYFTGHMAKMTNTALQKHAPFMFPPYAHGELAEISVGGRINFLFQKDSLVTGNLYDTVGNRSNKEALGETFGSEVIAALKEIIAKAKSIKGE